MRKEFTSQNWLENEKVDEIVATLRKAALLPVTTFNKAFSAPSIDLTETPDVYTAEIETPGFSRDEIELVIKDGLLTISGDKPITVETDEEIEKNCVMQERRYPDSFRRTISLPKNVDTENVRAKYENGLLSVEFQKLDNVDNGLKINIE